MGRIAARAELRPEAPALRQGARLLSYAELVVAAERLHAALRGQGLGEGEVVLLLLPSGVELILSFLAVASARGLATPLEARLTPSELAPRLEVARPALVIGTTERLAEAAPSLAACASLRAAIVVDDGEPALGDLPLVRPGPARAPLDDPPPLAEVSCHFTYKGLGYPLGAVHRARAYEAAIAGLERTFQAEPGDRHLCILPLQPVYGLVTAGLGPLCTGGEVLLEPELNPRRALEVLSRERIRFASLVPPLYRVLRASARRGVPELHPALTLSSGGTLLRAELAREVQGALGHPVYQGYGLTETLPVTSCVPGEDRPGALGRPLPGVSLEVRDAFGAPTPPGVAGEVCVRSEQLFAAYLRRPRETARFLRDGWMHTGDLGWLDPDGLLHFLGRREAFAKVNAQMVDLVEVEQALCSHPAVTRACASTRQNAKGEDELRVAVTLAGRAQVRLGELLQLARERLAPHKVPRRIRVYRALYEGLEPEF